MDFLYYLEPCRLVICRVCQNGVARPGLESNLVKLHKHNTTPEEHQHAIACFGHQRRCTTNKPTPPIPFTQIYSYGLKCRQCSYIYRSRGVIFNYAISHHQWHLDNDSIGESELGGGSFMPTCRRYRKGVTRLSGRYIERP